MLSDVLLHGCLLALVAEVAARGRVGVGACPEVEADGKLAGPRLSTACFHDVSAVIDGGEIGEVVDVAELGELTYKHSPESRSDARADET
eukprot:4555338-Pyramimonas_sp.AAC.1